jgi:hypothetical protein
LSSAKEEAAPSPKAKATHRARAVIFLNTNTRIRLYYGQAVLNPVTTSSISVEMHHLHTLTGCQRESVM